MQADQDQSNSGVDWAEALRRVQRRVSKPSKTGIQLARLRRRLEHETERTHWELIDRLAQAAQVDLNPMLEEVRRRNRNKRKLVRSVMKKAEAQAAERAVEECRRLVELRKKYVEDFGRLYASEKGNPEAKLKFVMLAGDLHATPDPSESCSLGSGCSDPDLGVHEAEAWAEPKTDDVGAMLYGRILTDNGDCTSTPTASNVYDVAFQRGGPRNAFHVMAMTVDLSGVGVGSAHLGDAGCGTGCNPAFDHTNGWLSAYILQDVGVVVYDWPLIQDYELFSRAGDYADSVTFHITTTRLIHPDVYLYGPAGGGGSLMCYVNVKLQARASGSGGRVSLDFTTPRYGISLGCVTLYGENM